MTKYTSYIFAALFLLGIAGLIYVSTHAISEIIQQRPRKNTTTQLSKTETAGPLNTEHQAIPEIILNEETIDDLPEPEEFAQSLAEVKEDIQTGEQQKTDPTTQLPARMNLDIPFFSQAPDRDRSLPRKEACEESSIVLAAHYLNDSKLTKKGFKEDVLALTEREVQLFGSYIDTNIKQTAELFDDYYGIGKTKIIDDPQIEDIKRELAQGNPIIAPFAGRELGNSHFTNGGPRYHMLVIRGYDENYFYTNDVGTRFGENFPYSYAVIMDALHDFVPEAQGDITTGKKRLLVLIK